MEPKKYKRIFISGPVSSYLRNEEDGWLHCIIISLRHLRKCDAVCMRPQWWISRGARLENGFAIRWSKDILMEAGEYIHTMQEGGTL